MLELIKIRALDCIFIKIYTLQLPNSGSNLKYLLILFWYYFIISMNYNNRSSIE